MPPARNRGPSRTGARLCWYRSSSQGAPGLLPERVTLRELRIQRLQHQCRQVAHQHVRGTRRPPTSASVIKPAASTANRSASGSRAVLTTHGPAVDVSNAMDHADGAARQRLDHRDGAQEWRGQCHRSMIVAALRRPAPWRSSL